MTIYEAVMKAADHIERNPQIYNFCKNKVPDCGTPGCAVGWVAHFLGCGAGELVSMTEAMRPFVSASGSWCDFHYTAEKRGFDMLDIQINAGAAAAYLRHVAAQYLAPPKPQQQPPDWQQMAARLATAAPIGEVA